MTIDAETRAFVASVADGSLAALDHEGHVRLAWSLSVRLPLARVLEQLPPILRRYAGSKGRPDIYHETVTFAFACLIHERVARAGVSTWSGFRDANPDLLDASLLKRYYADDVLRSPEARRIFVFPTPVGAPR